MWQCGKKVDGNDLCVSLMLFVTSFSVLILFIYTLLEVFNGLEPGGPGPKQHPHDSTLGESSSEAQSGRRLLGTNGGSLWLWCCLAQPGAR